MNWIVDAPDFVERIQQPKSFYLTEMSDKAVRAFGNSIQEAIELEQGVLPIWIETEGGDVPYLHAFLSLMISARKQDLKLATITAGEAASAGAFIFCYGDEGLRFMGEHGRLMIHGIQVGEMSEKRASEQKEFFIELMKEEGELLQVISAHVKGPRRKGWLAKEMAKRRDLDWYIDAKQAVKEGIANHIGLPNFSLKLMAEISVSIDPGVNIELA